MRFLKGGVAMFFKIPIEDGSVVKLAKQARKNLEKAGRKAKFYIDGMEIQGVGWKRVFKINIFNPQFGRQTFLFSTGGEIILEGNGKRSIVDMRRSAGLI